MTPDSAPPRLEAVPGREPGSRGVGAGVDWWESGSASRASVRALPRTGLSPVAVFAAVLGALVVGILLWRFDPAHNGFYPRCLLHSTTGLLCPGCGVLRASHQLLHGHLGEAFTLNPLFVAILPFAAWYGLSAWREHRNLATRQPMAKSAGTNFAWLGRLGVDPASVPGLAHYASPASVLAGALVGFSLARNLPLESWLAW